jgi:hypothetical protein
MSVVAIYRQSWKSRTIADMRVSFLLRVGIIVSIGLSTLATAQLRPDQLGRGGEWLSWAPEYRNAYVAGLVSGYMMGFYRACALADQLFDECGSDQQTKSYAPLHGSKAYP